MNGEATGPATVRNSNVRQHSSHRHSRSGLTNTPPIRRSRSFTDGMDIQTPLRRPTEHYTRISKGSLASCRSCSSFDDVDISKPLLPLDEYEDEDSYCEDLDHEPSTPKGDTKTERTVTEFSCYVPTRRNTISGKNASIQYYVPSRGPEKNDAWFPRSVLQDKDPKPAQYSAPSIKPVIASLGLKMKDVKLHSPIVVPKSSEQPTSERAEQRPAGRETDVSSDAPEQTVMRLVRQDTETESSRDPPQLERQETRRTRRSTRSASVPNASAILESPEVQANYKRKETQFSCTPDSSVTEVPANYKRKETQFSCSPDSSEQSPEVQTTHRRKETQFSCSPDSSVQSPGAQTKFRRKETQFSCSPDSSVQSTVAQAPESRESPQLEQGIVRMDTAFSYDMPDASTSKKPSRLLPRVKRQETRFSCDVPDLSESPKPSLLGSRVERKETEFSCSVPEVSASQTSSLEARIDRKESELSCDVPDCSEGQNSPLPEPQVKGKERDLSRDVPQNSGSHQAPPLKIWIERQETVITQYSSDLLESQKTPLLETRIETKESEFFRDAPNLSETQNPSLGGKLLRTEREIFSYLRTGLSQTFPSNPGEGELLQLETQPLPEETETASPGPGIAQASVNRQLETSLQVNAGTTSELPQNKSATYESSELHLGLAEKAKHMVEDIATEVTSFLPALPVPHFAVQTDPVEETIKPTSSLSSRSRKESAVVFKADSTPQKLTRTSLTLKEDSSPQVTSIAQARQSRVSFQVPEVDLTMQTVFLPEIWTQMKSIVEEDPDNTPLKQGQVPAIRRLSNVPQPDSPGSQVSPRTTVAPLESVAEQTIPVIMPTRIPSKRLSTVRSISQKDTPGRPSKDLRTANSDSALKKTIKTPLLLAMSKKSAATRHVVLNTEVEPTRSTEIAQLEPPMLSPEIVTVPGSRKVKTPSLRSGSSKRSGTARHALLSPSITTSQPVDMGLPIAPMLTPDIAAASGVGSGLEPLSVSLKHTETQSPIGMPNVSSLPMYRTIPTETSDSKEPAVSQSTEERLPVVISTNLFESGTTRPTIASAEWQKPAANAMAAKYFEQKAEESARNSLSTEEQTLQQSSERKVALQLSANLSESVTAQASIMSSELQRPLGNAMTAEYSGKDMKTSVTEAKTVQRVSEQTAPTSFSTVLVESETAQPATATSTVWEGLKANAIAVRSFEQEAERKAEGFLSDDVEVMNNTVQFRAKRKSQPSELNSGLSTRDVTSGGGLVPVAEDSSIVVLGKAPETAPLMNPAVTTQPTERRDNLVAPTVLSSVDRSVHVARLAEPQGELSPNQFTSKPDSGPGFRVVEKITSVLEQPPAMIARETSLNTSTVMDLGAKKLVPEPLLATLPPEMSLNGLTTMDLGAKTLEPEQPAAIVAREDLINSSSAMDLGAKIAELRNDMVASRIRPNAIDSNLEAPLPEYRGEDKSRLEPKGANLSSGMQLTASLDESTVVRSQSSQPPQSIISESRSELEIVNQSEVLSSAQLDELIEQALARTEEEEQFLSAVRSVNVEEQGVALLVPLPESPKKTDERSQNSLELTSEPTMSSTESKTMTVASSSSINPGGDNNSQAQSVYSGRVFRRVSAISRNNSEPQLLEGIGEAVLSVRTLVPTNRLVSDQLPAELPIPSEEAPVIESESNLPAEKLQIQRSPKQTPITVAPKLWNGRSSPLPRDSTVAKPKPKLWESSDESTAPSTVDQSQRLRSAAANASQLTEESEGGTVITSWSDYRDTASVAEKTASVTERIQRGDVIASSSTQVSRTVAPSVKAAGIVKRVTWKPEDVSVSLAQETTNTTSTTGQFLSDLIDPTNVPLPRSTGNTPSSSRNASQSQFEFSTISSTVRIDDQASTVEKTEYSCNAALDAATVPLPKTTSSTLLASQNISLQRTEPTEIPLPASIMNTPTSTWSVSVQPSRPEEASLSASVSTSVAPQNVPLIEPASVPLPASVDNTPIATRTASETRFEPVFTPLPPNASNPPIATRKAGSQARVEPRSIPLPASTVNSPAASRKPSRNASRIEAKNTTVTATSVELIEPRSIPLPASAVNSPLASRKPSRNASRIEAKNTTVAATSVEVIEPRSIPLPASVGGTPVASRNASRVEAISLPPPTGVKTTTAAATSLEKNDPGSDLPVSTGKTITSSQTTASQIRIDPQSVPLPASKNNTPAITRSASQIEHVSSPLPTSTVDVPARMRKSSQIEPASVPLPASIDNTAAATRNASQVQPTEILLPAPASFPLPASRDNTAAATRNASQVQPTEIPLPASIGNTPVATWNVLLESESAKLRTTMSVPLASQGSSRPADIPLPASIGTTPVATWNTSTDRIEPVSVFVQRTAITTPLGSQNAPPDQIRPADVPLPPTTDNTAVPTRTVSLNQNEPAIYGLLRTEADTRSASQNPRFNQIAPPDIPLPATTGNTAAATRTVSWSQNEPAIIEVLGTVAARSALETITLDQIRPTEVPLPATTGNTTAATRTVSLSQNEPATIDVLGTVTARSALETVTLDQITPTEVPLPATRTVSLSQNAPVVMPSGIPLPATAGNTAAATRTVSLSQNAPVIIPSEVPLPATAGNTAAATRTVSLNETAPANVDLPGTMPDMRSASQNLLLGQVTSTDMQQVTENRTSATDMSVEYWGFVPAVEEQAQDVIQYAVQGAFQDAVRKAAQEDMLPANIPASEMSTAYRRLIADSLDEAAKTADEYLRRSSQDIDFSPSAVRDTQPSRQKFEDVRIESKNITNQAVTSDIQEDKSKEILRDQKTILNMQPERGSSPADNVVVRSPPDHRSYTPSQYSVNQESASTVRIGSNKVALESYERLASISRQEESPDEPKAEGESTLWRAWNALSGSRRSSYAPIPTRRSSVERQVTERKPSSKVSPTQLSRATTAFRNLSLGSIKERPRESGSFDFDKEDEPAVIEIVGDESSIVRPSPTVTRRRTVHWLRELLTSEEPYATRLTALPPRIARDRWALQRSETAPAKPVEKLFLGATQKPALANELQLREMEAFSKTVVDLEQLLSEALLIARQAVEDDKSDVIPVLENAAAVLRSGRPDLKALPADFSRQKLGRSDFVSDSFEEKLEAGSIHESNRSTYSEDRFSIGDDSDAGDREELLYHGRMIQSEDEVGENSRVVIVESAPNPRKSWAGWPPTGRASTPFPPSSAIESTPSTERGEPDSNVPQAQEDRSETLAQSARKEVVAEVVEIPVQEAAEIRQESAQDADVRRSKGRDLRGISDEVVIELDTLVEQNDEGRVQNAGEIVRDPPPQSDEIRKVSLPKPPRSPAGPEGRPTTLPDKREVRNFIKEYSQPPIAPRHSSLKLRAIAQAAERARSAHTIPARTKPIRTTSIRVKPREPKGKAVVRESPLALPPKTSPAASTQLSLDGPPQEEIDLGVSQQPLPQSENSAGIRRRAGGYDQPEGSYQAARGSGHEGIPEEKAVESHELVELPLGNNLPTTRRNAKNRKLEDLNLKNKSHVSLKEHHRFSLGRSKKRQPIARDWSPARKRFVAAVNCISTALIGALIGIYAGEVPSVQYYLVDQHHFSILGNVFLFLGLSIPTFYFWPLPLLHGRKPYILASLSIAMPLLFPQAVVISAIRSPNEVYWRVGLLLPRAVMGFVLGFANMNFQATLLDLFGASLQSGNPHQETIDEFDVRRHGGGMGAWLGLWTWCYIGSIGIGFTVGAVIINYIAPSWGMYIGILILLFISVLQVLTPEVRRGAYRRSVAEVKTDQGVSRRVARGEVMMHRVQTGPKWFGQELYHGFRLSHDMMRQPGFLVLAIYQAWIYGQVVLLIVLLGSLLSNSYKFTSPLVGAGVSAIPIGSLLALPFDNAGLFSRSRTEKARTNSNTFNENKISWRSHVLRRAIFTFSLPVMGACYTATSSGPPIPWILPVLFAAAFGFLSNLAIAECVGIIMETWDTSDLQPGMTGRPRGNPGEDNSNKRTNYSSFPRVASAFGITQGMGFIIAALATAVGGVATRNLGQQAATGVMAGILFVLTMLLFAVLVRWQEVQIIPNAKTGEMDLYLAQRRLTAMRPPGAAEVEEPWRPTIIGNPSSKTREMSIVELGSMTRWSEIRRKNRLYDDTVANPDLAVLHQAYVRLEEKQERAVRSVQGSLRSAHGSLRGRLSREPSQEGGSRRGRGRDRRREEGPTGESG